MRQEDLEMVPRPSQKGKKKKKRSKLSLDGDTTRPSDLTGPVERPLPQRGVSANTEQLSGNGSGSC